MSNETVKKILWWVCLFVAPLILLTMELFHPAGFTTDPGMFQYLSVPHAHTAQHKALYYFGPNWWFTLHMIQTPLVCLVAVGLLLMMDGIDREDGQLAMIFSWVARALILVFIIYYTSLDAIGGVGLGKTIEITESMANGTANQAAQLTPDQVEGVAQVLNATWTDPWVGGEGSFISETGSWAIFFATVFLALSLFLAKKAPWPPLVILVAFGWELQVSHTAFHGPIAFGFLIIAAAWMWWATKRVPYQPRLSQPGYAVGR
ncbi:MAG TPA: hypothetical protein P5526_31915 [Anaerolineae bacterium]|nr:hypothetical protein [Anaerolineae bacterium]